MWDRLGVKLYPLLPEPLRGRAIKNAEAWILERMKGAGGLGAICPAMVNAYEAIGGLGYPPDHPLRAQEKKAIDDLLIIGEHSAYCQPCVSPVWDTAWAVLALQEIGDAASRSSVKRE